MKRAVIFAHYDRQNLIDDYVVYYLKALKEAAQELVFVSCCNIENMEKLDGIASHIIAEPHDEYDFGSYKRGFLYLLPRLDEFDEIIFANDSCFGPFHSLNPIFDEMDLKGCDFWGITKNNFGYRKKPNHFFVKRPHIQSYFVVLKKNVFTSDVFKNFITSVKHEEKKELIISNYEIGLTELLCDNGFKYDVYVNAYNRINNITILKWRQIILEHRMPFMKCSLPRLVNKNSTTVEGYQDIIKQVSDYPVELIENNIARIQYARKGKHTSPIWFKRIFFDIIAEFPFVIRKLIAIFIARCLPFIRD